MGRRMERVEGLLRLLAMVLTGIAACMLGFNKQTKEIVYSYYRTATVRDMRSLWALMIMAAAASGYESLQLFKCFLVAKFARERTGKWEAWICFVLDQGVMYALIAGTAAVLQSSAFAIKGMPKLQWMKLCDMYGRLCRLNGVALFFLVFASVIMSILSTISAHKLSRFYPKSLKPSKHTQPSVVPPTNCSL